jgi:hypothetical protein
MTTKQDFLPVFDRLCIAYSDRIVKLNTSPADKAAVLKVWFEILKDIDTQLLQAAALEFMSSPSAFPPTPGQLRGKAIEIMKRANQVPSAVEAWGMVQAAPANGMKTWSEERDDGWHIFNEPYEFPHPLVEKVSRNLGWPERFWTDNLVSDRSKFMRYYEDELHRATVEATSLPAVQDFIAQAPSGSADINQIMQGFERAALERGEA